MVEDGGAADRPGADNIGDGLSAEAVVEGVREAEERCVVVTHRRRAGLEEH